MAEDDFSPIPRHHSEFDPGGDWSHLREGFDQVFAGIVKKYDTTGRPGELSFSKVDDVPRPLPEEISWGVPSAEFPDGNVS